MNKDEYAPLRTYISNFINITDEAWSLHRQALTVKNLRRGDFLLREGSVCDHVSFINRGSFRIYTIIDGQEVTNYFFFENSYVTDYESFLTRKTSSDNIVALEDSEILQLNYDSVQMLYEKVPAWQKFGRLMAEHVYIQAVERTKSLQYNSSEALYLKIMEEQPQIIERVPQQYIASYMGIQPESLSRIRKRLMTEVKKS